MDLDTTIQEIIASSIFFLVLPVIYCKMILKEPISSLGLRVMLVVRFFLGRMTMIAVGVSFCFSLPIEGFREAYQLPCFYREELPCGLLFYAEVVVAGE